MNLYLLQFVGKMFSLFVVSIASLFGSVVVNSESTSLKNQNKEKNLSVVNKVIEYETEYRYNRKLPSNLQKVLVEGVNGVFYVDEITKEEKVLSEPITEVIEIGTGDYGEYVGRLTSYGPDCPGCSAVGNVACFTKNRTNHSLINDGIYYEDDTYGRVRILAADHLKFPCGTIVLVDPGTTEPFYGVVLDTGASMRNAWREDGYVWMDVAYESQEAARNGNTTSRNTKYSVQRWGW